MRRDRAENGAAGENAGQAAANHETCHFCFGSRDSFGYSFATRPPVRDGGTHY